MHQLRCEWWHTSSQWPLSLKDLPERRSWLKGARVAADSLLVSDSQMVKQYLSFKDGNTLHTTNDEWQCWRLIQVLAKVLTCQETGPVLFDSPTVKQYLSFKGGNTLHTTNDEWQCRQVLQVLAHALSVYGQSPVSPRDRTGPFWQLSSEATPLFQGWQHPAHHTRPISEQEVCSLF